MTDNGIVSAAPLERETVQNKEERIIPKKESLVEKANENVSVPNEIVQNTNEGETYDVIAVVDGDTIKVAMGGALETVRIIGINTPETVDPRRPVQCFGKEASARAKELLLGNRATLKADGTQSDRDKYGRLLRYVFINGVDYGKEMIRRGYAYEYTYNIPYEYQTDYKEAQTLARDEGVGLWNPDACNTVSTSKELASGIVAAYYTSSNSRAKNYYPSSCEAWKNLSKTYLQTFSSVEDLLAQYPGRTLSKQCE
jgi:micrococcal nuclease